ncbi:hypothetical protein [Actinomadura pelletieri]|nr:hypothetical protein [Actinomadura pelletieri]
MVLERVWSSSCWWAVAVPIGPLVVLGWLGSDVVVFWGRAES